MIPEDTSIPAAEYTEYIAEREDGFYWIDLETGVELGPFATVALAIADMKLSPESDFEPGASLAEAEAELDIADWIDPETGLPAEDSVPHIEN